MMNTSLIHEYCEVIKEVFTPMHAIYFKEDGFGFADIETESEGIVKYSCDSVKEFDSFVEAWEGE